MINVNDILYAELFVITLSAVLCTSGTINEFQHFLCLRIHLLSAQVKDNTNNLIISHILCELVKVVCTFYSVS